MKTRDDILREDFERMQRFRAQNAGLIDFQTNPQMPPTQYKVTLHCKGIRLQDGRIREIDMHEVGIELGPDYPIKQPNIAWFTPIYHPNLRATGVCVYGWSPSVRLDDLCSWLWDMTCYRLYNLDDALNRTFDKALPKIVVEWMTRQHKQFPLDTRTLHRLAPLSSALESDDVIVISDLS